MNFMKENMSLKTNIIVFDHINNIEGLDLKLLLKTINKRISILYNRSHIIPHTYFLTLINKNESEAKKELAVIFKSKIIPLLQRYFKNDWEKIREVLADNKKMNSNEKYQIIKKKDNDYEIDSKVLLDIISYKKIYEL